jgi:hypothetical protein
MVRIAGGGGGASGLTVKQVEHYEHVIDIGGGITDDDTPSEVQQKLGEYYDAVKALHDLGGGKGPMHFAKVPDGGYTGHYEIDPDALDGTIKVWQDVLDGLREDERDIDFIRKVTPPAPDKHASVAQAKALADFGQRMYDRNNDMKKYAERYLKALKQTKQQYAAHERHAHESFRRQAGSA